MVRKPLVYVAGPIQTGGDVLGNVRRAVLATEELLSDGIVVPFLPHLSALSELIAPMDYEEWLAYDFEVIKHCHAIYRLSGESAGADREVKFAESLGLPMFRETFTLNAWAKAWTTVAGAEGEGRDGD